MTAVTSASALALAANAAVAAQKIDENASAKVATRDAVCRRRKWLRLACARNQNWIAVDAAAATMIPNAATLACNDEVKASATRNGAKTSAMPPITASILARTITAAAIGALATRSGASSPEMVSHASPPAS